MNFSILKKGIYLTAAFFILSTATFAKTNIVTTTVPFQNVFLNPNDTLQASFSFGINTQLFCFDNSLQTLGIFTWPYQGATQTSTLPIFLTLNPAYQGSLTDPNGTLTITNNLNVTLQLSCIYSI